MLLPPRWYNCVKLDIPEDHGVAQEGPRRRLQDVADAHVRAIMHAWDGRKQREEIQGQMIPEDDGRVAADAGVLGYRPPNEHLEWNARS